MFTGTWGEEMKNLSSTSWAMLLSRQQGTQVSKVLINRDLHLGRKWGEGMWKHTSAGRTTPEKSGCVSLEADAFICSHNKASSFYPKSIKGHHTLRATQAETWSLLGTQGGWMTLGPRALLCSAPVSSTQYTGRKYLWVEDPEGTEKTEVSFLTSPRDDGLKINFEKMRVYIFLIFELWTEISTF